MCVSAMVDFHTHILPGMDDGSQSAEMSLAMLRELKKQGIETVAATPHFDMRRESIEHFLDRRAKAIYKLGGARGIPAVVFGAEVLYCGSNLHRIAELDQLCIGNTRYLLVENFVQEWDAGFEKSLMQLMLERDLIPMIAHIERYYTIPANRAAMLRLREEGAVLQMNASQFLRRFSRRRALRLLRDRTVQVLGSDCHNMENRRPNLGEALSVIQKYGGEDMLCGLRESAETVLRNQTL